MLKANSKYYPRYIGVSKISPKEYEFFKQRVYNAIKRGDISTKPVINKHTGFEIHFTKNALKHGLNFRGSVNKTKSFTIIREILKYSLLVKTAVDKADPRLTVYYFLNIILIDGKAHRVHITVKSIAGKSYYHHDLMSVKENRGIKNPG